MTTHRQTVPIAQAVPGCLLAEPVLDDRGQVLLGACTKLTTGLIQALGSRGVTTLCIDCPESPESPESGEGAQVQGRRERSAQRVAHLFRHCTRQGTINPLMHLVIRYREGSAP